MVCMITLCDISMPFRSLHHPLPINGRHCSYIHTEAAGAGNRKHATARQEAARKRWRGDHFDIHNGGLRLDSPFKGPAGSSLTIVSAQSHSTCREKGKGLKDRPFPAPQFVAARRAFHNVMVKPALRWNNRDATASVESSGRGRWAGGWVSF